MENIILVDFNTPKDWAFKKALEDATNKKWTVIKSVSNRNHGTKMQVLIRYLKYFGFPFKIFLKRRKYDSVLAWQQFYGLVLAFYFKLFRVKQPPEITVMTFIYKQKESFFGVIYGKFIRFVVKSGYIKRFIVFSKSEQEYYAELFGISRENFVVETLGIQDVYGIVGSRIPEEKYFLAAGRSNRDYDFLRNAWQNKDKIKIVCDTCKETDTECIKYLKNCYHKEFVQELSNCYAVIVPLQDEKISSGQLVILQAMMLKKPVIVTKNDTVTDYVEDGIDGFIINKDAESLSWAIEQVKDSKIYDTIVKNARKSFEDKFSLYAMGARIGLKLLR